MPRPTAHIPQPTAAPTVIRFRLRSATPEALAEDDAAAEHVGQAAAAPLVQQDEHDREQAEDGQHDLKDELQQGQIHEGRHLPRRQDDRYSIRHGPDPFRTRPAW